MINEQDRKIIYQGNWFTQCSEQLQNELLLHAKVVELNSGESLFLRGDKNCGLYCVISGAVRVSGANSEGKEAVLSFIPQAVWFGEVALFDGGTRTHDVYAQTTLRLVHITERTLNVLLNNHPEYWRDFGVLLSQKMRLLFSSLEDHALLSAKQKVCKCLLMLATFDTGSSKIYLTQQQLADMTYLTRQTINQILQDLSKHTAITLHYQCIDIIDKPALEAILNSTL
ncbi:Crp/Fnr family transcriptional regulator [Pseudoalteromonas shioyasakiensis]|uniref:Crp/Fnr family transcriptional regulator n=1 Tax=Pseudoalteromonas shioyasakiensis TaxID=1190813 RepID=UPI002118C15E|nr:Crp/Fnr family transcriptional regulator [Pseudoalteromonas shioyasakiensis]MCQ8876873.1 Crp/Fnr family transcriptional regulator [Pseudoalteromonas shioyasakiensis]